MADYLSEVSVDRRGVVHVDVYQSGPEKKLLGLFASMPRDGSNVIAELARLAREGLFERAPVYIEIPLTGGDDNG